MSPKTRLRRVLLAATVAVTSMLGVGLTPGVAHAIIGRPLTPFSYAGVARRTTRRAVAYGAVARPYVGVPVVAPVVVARPAVVW